MKSEKQQWKEARESLNRFILEWTNHPIRISRTNRLQVKKKVLGFYIWVNYKTPEDIPVHRGIDDPLLGLVSLRTRYIKKGKSIDLRKYVGDEDIAEDSSRFLGSLIRYLKNKNFID